MVDLELVVLAINLLDESQQLNVPNWHKKLVDFFVSRRCSVTMEQQMNKRQAVYRKTHRQQQLPSDRVWLDDIRGNWKNIRDDLVGGFEAFKVALDWVLQPPCYSYTIDSLLVEAGQSRSSEETKPSSTGFQTDHVIELQLVVAALNRLWENTYSERADWSRTIVEFFDGDDNKQRLTGDENEQKHLAISRAIHCPSGLMDEKAWIRHVRARWVTLRNRLDGFTAFKLHMDALLELNDCEQNMLNSY